MMRGALAAALAASLGVVVLPHGPLAQQPNPAAAPRRPMPVAATTLAKTPDAFYGEVVSMTAPVARMLSGSAFVAGEILVIAPTLTEPLDPQAYVTVVGEAFRFDAGEVGRRATGYTLDLGPDATAAHDGRPAILATAVVNAALVDLAIRRPPPLTPEEAVFDQVMKRVGPAFSSLGKAVAGSDAAAAADNATTLGAAFTEAEAFWKARGTADALAWTRGARTHVTALERAAAAGSWDQARASAGELGKVCQACHAAYRERLDDGSYRLRSGAARPPSTASPTP
jgi:cytochrome c556